MEINKDNTFRCDKLKSNIKLDSLKEKVLLLVEKDNLNEEEENFIRKYCELAIDKVVYTEDEQVIYNFYIKEIFKKLYINNQVMEMDIRTVSQYLVLKKAKDLGIYVYFEMLEDERYTFIFGEKSQSCFENNDGVPTIYIRNSVFDKTFKDGQLSQRKIASLFDLLFHEIRHAKQDEVIKKQIETGIESKEVLIWIKETLIRTNDSDYYYNNYKNYHRECDAELESLIMTYDILKEYFNYFDQSVIDQVGQELLSYYNNTRKLQHLTPQGNYKSSDDSIVVIDSYIDLIAPNNAEYIYKYLSIQYDFNGERRSSTDLITEYDNKKQMLEKKYDIDSELYMSKLKDLNELYNYLILGAKEKENKKTIV